MVGELLVKTFANERHLYFFHESEVQIPRDIRRLFGHGRTETQFLRQGIGPMTQLRLDLVIPR
jgi:hypothetical protein